MMALTYPERFRPDALVRIDPATMLSITQSRGGYRAQHSDCGKPAARRALHATVEIDQKIAPEHYRAVVEVIGYVMRLNRAVLAQR